MVRCLLSFCECSSPSSVQLCPLVYWDYKCIGWSPDLPCTTGLGLGLEEIKVIVILVGLDCGAKVVVSSKFSPNLALQAL